MQQSVIMLNWTGILCLIAVAPRGKLCKRFVNNWILGIPLNETRTNVRKIN